MLGCIHPIEGACPSHRRQQCLRHGDRNTTQGEKSYNPLHNPLESGCYKNQGHSAMNWTIFTSALRRVVERWWDKSRLDCLFTQKHPDSDFILNSASISHERRAQGAQAHRRVIQWCDDESSLLCQCEWEQTKLLYTLCATFPMNSRNKLHLLSTRGVSLKGEFWCFEKWTPL